MLFIWDVTFILCLLWQGYNLLIREFFFCIPGCHSGLKAVVASINRLIYALDARFCPVVHLRSVFFKTILVESLGRLGISQVMEASAYTHYCVNATVFDAYAHDLLPGLFSDAVISHLAEESARMVERMRRNGYHVMTTDEYLAQLGSSKKTPG